MARVENKKTHVVADIWQAYARKLLFENPEYWGRFHNHIENFYVCTRRDGKMVVVHSYEKFRKVLEDYFIRAKKAIIFGEAHNIGGHLGKIAARRVERDFRKKGHKRIDWGRTSQQSQVWSEEKGKMVYKTIVYHTADDWVRIGWNRYMSLITHSQFYEFKITKNLRSGEGFNQQLIAALNNDKLLRFRYLYYPLKTSAEKAALKQKAIA